MLLRRWRDFRWFVDFGCDDRCRDSVGLYWIRPIMRNCMQCSTLYVRIRVSSLDQGQSDWEFHFPPCAVLEFNSLPVAAMRTKKNCARRQGSIGVLKSTSAYKTGNHLTIRRGRPNRHFFSNVVPRRLSSLG